MFIKRITKNKLSKWIEYLIYVFVFLIPWQTRYIYKYLTLNGSEFEYGKFSIYLSELVLILVIIFLIFYIKPRHLFYNFKNVLTPSGSPFKRGRIWDLPRTVLISFSILLVALITFFGSLNYQSYFYGLIKLAEAIILCFLISKIKVNYTKIGIAFVLSIFIHSILGIYQFFSQSVFASKYLGIAQQISSNAGVSVLEGGFGRLLRAYGGFSHPNIFGGFLVIAILFLLIVYFQKAANSKLYSKAIFWFVLIFLFNTLILSFSRSAWLALIISLAVLFIYSLYKRVVFKKLLSILIILVLVFSINFVLFNDFFKTRIQQQNRLEIKSNIERLVLKNQALNLLNKNWFLGTGINNYVFAVYKNIDSNLNVWEYQPVHNVYLLVFIELGILGLILYACLLLCSLYKAFSSSDLSKFILGLIVLVIIIINFFDHYFYTYWSGLIIMFLIIGLLNNKKPIDFN